MFAGDVAEGDGVAERQAGMEEGIVRGAVELAAQVARGVQALDNLALLGGDTAILIGENAGGDGGAADVTADAPEGSGHKLVHIFRILAEIEVLALLTQIIVAVEGLDGLVDRQPQLLGQLLDGVGAEGVDQLGEDAHMQAGILILEVAGHDEIRHARVGITHVVVVVDLAVPAERAGLLMLVIHVLADETWLPAQDIGDIGHVDLFGDETLARHVQVEEGVLIPHQARVKVVHDMAVGHGLHRAACFDGKDVAVAGAVVDLLIEVLDIRAEAANHGRVVLIGAGREDDGLGVKLHKAAVLALTHAADDGAVRILDELHDGRGEVDLEVIEAFLRVGENAGDKRAVVVRLGPEPGGKDLDLVLTEVIGLGAVPGAAGEDHGGVLVLAHTGLLVLPFGLLGDAAALADKADGLLGALNVGLEQLAVGTPGVHGGGKVDPLFQAALGRARLHDSGGAVALGDGDGLLLKDGDLRAELSRMDSGGHAGGTGAANDDIHIDLFGEIGDRLKDDSGGVDVLGRNVGQDIRGAVGLDLRLDRAGNHSLALGLRDAVGQSQLHGAGGERGAGDAVDLGALGGEDLGGQLLGSSLADGRGLLGNIKHDVDDAVFIKGGGDGHVAHADGRGRVGAGGIDSLGGGAGAQGAEAHTGHGQRGRGGEGALQEFSSADLRHLNTLLLVIVSEFCYNKHKPCPRDRVNHFSRSWRFFNRDPAYENQ